VVLVGCAYFASSQATQYTNKSTATLPQIRTVDLSTDARLCLERSAVKGAIQPHEGIKPSELSGDFDGDGIGDVAVVVKGPKTGRNGVLICTARQTTVLGADQPLQPPFSNMPNDNFVSSNWEMFSKNDVADVHKSLNGRQVQVAFPIGDSIAMIWEDAICLIYSDGSRYRWVCGE
jgi:hypothetical protein